MKTAIARQAIIYLGFYLQNLSEEEMLEIGYRANSQNGWFTPEQVKYTLKYWAKALETNNLDTWLQPYAIPENAQPKKVGIIMAGNIPLVGFHDLISVLLSSHIACCKLSSQDTYLPSLLIDKMSELEPDIKNQIEIRERLSNIDAVIATGSNNSARYFKQYFGHLPHIIRKNRHSVAILEGNESPAELEKLGLDMLQYYGLGCRSVSKLLVPKGYNFTPFFEAIEPYQNITTNHKWVNNYDYHKSIYLINKEDHLDNGFLLLKESEALGGPVSVVYFQYYNNHKELAQWFSTHKDELQCIVGNSTLADNGFGQAQKPQLANFADGIDTVTFLLAL